MADISKISPDDGSTILNIKDSNAVHWADNAILGAKNFFDIYSPNTINGSFTKITNGASIVATSAGNYQNTRYYVNIPKNTTMRIKFNAENIANGVNMVQVKGSNDNSSFTQIISLSGNTSYDATFNSGDYAYYTVQLFITGGSGASGDGVKYTNIILYLNSDTDDTYASYAMTNRELTEAVTPTDQSMSALVGTLNTGNSTLRKCGKIVALSAQLSGVTATANTWTNVIELDSASTPSVAYQGILYSPAGFGQFKVNTNGKIQIYPYSALSNSNLFLNATYML